MNHNEFYRVYAKSKSNGCVMRRWTYNSKKAFEAQKDRRKRYKTYYDIVCEIFDSETGTWYIFSED